MLAPYARGGKIGLFGGAGVGKTVFIQELIVRIALFSFLALKTGIKWLILVTFLEQHRQGPRWLLRVLWCR